MTIDPGWYVDPQNKDRERYWDGNEWTAGDRWRRGDTAHTPAASQAAPRRGEIAPGWYVDPDDEAQERYWNGAMWGSNRPRTEGAVALPRRPASVIADGDTRIGNGLSAAAAFLYLLTVLCAVGAVIGGIALITHKTCGVNPYDPTLRDCQFNSHHPYASSGWAVLVGGLAQAFLFAVVARLCQIVDGLRARAS